MSDLISDPAEMKEKRKSRRCHNFVLRIQDLYDRRVISGPDEIAEVRHETGCLSQLPKNPGICECDVQIILKERVCPRCHQPVPR